MRQPFPTATPSEWKKAPAKYVLSRQKRPPRASDGIVTAFRDGEVTLRENRRTEGFTNALQEIGYQGIRQGDLVVHGMDAFAGAIGVSDADGKASPVVHAYIGVQGVDVRFYSYLLRTLAENGFVASLAKGIRQRSTSFDPATLGSLELPVPLAQAQRAIADFLDRETERIDQLVEKKRRLIELLEERLASHIYHAVQAGSGPPTPVAYLAEYINGKAFKPDELGSTGLPVVRIRQLNDADAPFDYYDGPYDPKYEINDGDLIFSWSASLSVGIWSRGKALLNQHLFKVEPRFGFRKMWLSFALQAAISEFESLMHGSAMTHLTLDKLKQVKVPVPPFDEQMSIENELQSAGLTVQRLMGKLSVQLDKLAEYRRALITSAVTGQIDVTAEAPEPEEAIA